MVSISTVVVVVTGCTHTLSSVVLVDLQGVENIARCFALFCAFLSLGLLTGSPFMGTRTSLLICLSVRGGLHSVLECLGHLVFWCLDTVGWAM